MAGFETIVRPVIVPNIRPVPTRSLSPEDDPTKGFATIHGSSGQSVDLPFSFSVNMSKSKQQEVRRREDKARVFQKESDGTINRDNFIDINVMNKIAMDETGPGFGTPGVGSDTDLGPLSAAEKIETSYHFNPIEEKDNIEILEKDITTKNPNRV